jgi:hypothetical protein
MLTIKNNQYFLTGPAGKMQIPSHDEITLKLAMLYEGECTELGPLAAARKFGYSKPRYFQLRHLLANQGATALQSQPRGPKCNYRRTGEIVRQVIRQRFLDPDASVEVIAQKLKQTQHPISIRSVERVVADYGLQKKTLRP